MNVIVCKKMKKFFPRFEHLAFCGFLVIACIGLMPGFANADGAPVLNATQGYNPATGAYETAANKIAAGDTYLVLYGSFASSGNTVLINGQAWSADNVKYQSTNQINILLGSFENTSFGIAVSNAGGASGSLNVTPLVPASPAPTCTFAAAPSSVQSGQSSSLSWNCSNATSCSISNGVGSVTASGGSRTVTPSGTTSYSLSCAGAGGSTTAQATVTVTPLPAATSTLIGPYFWTGSVSGVASSNIMAKGLQLTKNLGARVIRITMNAKADMDYLGGSCIPNFTLKNLAARSDFNAILSDPQFTTVIITANDGVSFGNCVTELYLDPTFYTPANTQKIQNEYTDFANYLKQFNKTFIIDNWEGDNDAYCDASYEAALNGNANCPGASNNLAGLQKWFQARYAGIHAAGASNVFDAIEFNIVTALAKNHLPSVLYNVIPNVTADYYSYSSYESINVSPGQFSTDIDTIRATTHNAPLIIGEMGFRVGDFGDAIATANRLGQMLEIAKEKNIPYAIIWNLLDVPAGFGLYDSSGAITTSGTMIENQIGNLSVSANALNQASSLPSVRVTGIVKNLATIVATSSPAASSSTTVSSSALGVGHSLTSSVTAFPVTVVVAASSLYVRSAPNTSASLAGSQVLHAGDEFTAVNGIRGENVNGNDLWWVSSFGNYVWSGGTQVGGKR
jgi:hypothetical protein